MSRFQLDSSFFRDIRDRQCRMFFTDTDAQMTCKYSSIYTKQRRLSVGAAFAVFLDSTLTSEHTRVTRLLRKLVKNGPNTTNLQKLGCYYIMWGVKTNQPTLHMIPSCPTEAARRGLMSKPGGNTNKSLLWLLRSTCNSQSEYIMYADRVALGTLNIPRNQTEENGNSLKWPTVLISHGSEEEKSHLLCTGSSHVIVSLDLSYEIYMGGGSQLLWRRI